MGTATAHELVRHRRSDPSLDDDPATDVDGGIVDVKRHRLRRARHEPQHRREADNKADHGPKPNPQGVSSSVRQMQMTSASTASYAIAKSVPKCRASKSLDCGAKTPIGWTPSMHCRDETLRDAQDRFTSLTCRSGRAWPHPC